jgi:trans-aconitate 2-methyltransferase
VVTWDPEHYLRFADHRLRPGLELAARIPDVHPRTVVDLGSGTGHLTSRLAERWPDASVVGIDRSRDMVASARSAHAAVEFILGDIATWDPSAQVDVIFSNATLHWLDDHAGLFRRLRSYLAPGGVLAVQMPDNWAAPTHRIPAEILDHGEWPDSARSQLMRDRLAAPEDYARWLQPADVDMWHTTYFHELSGEDPVWTWVTGSVLRPVLAALDGSELERVSELCRERYRAAYPADTRGISMLPFSRLFFVAVVP